LRRSTHHDASGTVAETKHGEPSSFSARFLDGENSNKEKYINKEILGIRRNFDWMNLRVVSVNLARNNG
jgi:hypothetical protein